MNQGSLGLGSFGDARAEARTADAQSKTAASGLFQRIDLTVVCRHVDCVAGQHRGRLDRPAQASSPGQLPVAISNACVPPA